MALSFAHGAIQWSDSDSVGTTYTVSGLSFQPKAILFYTIGLSSATDAASQADGENRGVGFAVSTSSRRAVGTASLDNVITSNCGAFYRNDCVASITDAGGVNTARLDINAINSDGFQLIVDDQTGSPHTVFWKAWGGSDITVAVIGDITEPAATGNQDYTVTGFVSGATDQVVLFAGCQSTAAINTDAATDSGFHVGFATAANGVTVCGNSDDASTAMDTDGYCQGGECVSMIVLAGGNPDARATLTQWNTDGFRLNWLARATTGRRTAFMAIKGGAWAVGEYTINGNTGSATATVSGLSFAPVGIVLIGSMTAEDTAGNSHQNDRISIGGGSSTSSRRAMGILDENATASSSSEIDQVIEYDQVLAFPSTSGTLQSAYDINAMNSDGFTIIVDTAGGVASEWQGYLAFGSAATGSTLDAQPGSYSIAGTAANFNIVMPAAAGSYSITGTAATLEVGLPANLGSYSIAGTAANFQVVMPAGAGTYTIAGTAAGLFKGRTIVADAGAYSLTGTAATFNIVTPAAAGTYSIAGTAATFKITLNATPGSVIITGTDASLIVGGNTVLQADPGSFIITGTAASLEVGRRLAAQAGSYSITGTAVAFDRSVVAASGSYLISGTAANLIVSGVGHQPVEARELGGPRIRAQVLWERE